MTHFVDPSEHISNAAAHFSPDRQYFAVITERGVLKTNLVEDSLWIFETANVLSNLRSSRLTRSVGSMPVVKMTAANSPVIFDIEWLDSSHLAFRIQKRVGGFQLMNVSAKTRAVTPISANNQNTGLYGTFDVRNGNSIYTTVSPLVKRELQAAMQHQSVKIGTGLSLDDLLHLSGDGGLSAGEEYDWRELWAVVHGKRFQVHAKTLTEPFHISPTIYSRGVSLSPDGRFALVALPVESIPEQWSSYSIHKGQVLFSRFKPGTQDLHVRDTGLLVYHFVLLDLMKETAEPLFDAPIGASGGYHHPRLQAVWSPDGRNIALVNTYLPLTGEHTITTPCIAVFNTRTKKAVCLIPIASNDEEEHHERFTSITDLQFDSTKPSKLHFTYQSVSDSSSRIFNCREARDESWACIDNGSTAANKQIPLQVTVQQSLNDPPELIATDQLSRRITVILDPNSALRKVNLGKASEYYWSDSFGRTFVGGLVMPPDYVAGRRYPLVIQTHGLFKNEFISSGGLTTAFAARPLAAAGMIVLQVDDQQCTINYQSSPEESACAIGAYQSAAEKLVAQGLVDREKIGIIGFSQTCIYVLQALVTSRVHFAAATISDGDTGGYLGFLKTVGHWAGDQVLNLGVGRIGAPPVGDGMKTWIKRSAVFNMDKVSTPLRVEAVGSSGILVEWEPYAILRYLRKPADLILIDYGTHPLSNPNERLASQGGNVDWFRFWLTNEEDSDPSKASQYARWRGLRTLGDSSIALGASTQQK
ncbi:MAG TPA: hypothetical protein VN684_08840 [Terriglobales bacterium]|nr:hypothetical protein [Terriglobales bacterium]